MRQASEATKARTRRVARLILFTLLLGPIGFALAIILNRLEEDHS